MKFSLVILAICFFTSCVNLKEEHGKFIYEHDESCVELKILNGNDFLIYGEPTRVDFLYTNINVNSCAIQGRGIRLVGGKVDKVKTEINVPFNPEKPDTLNVQLRFDIEGERMQTEFNIPIKKKG